MDKFEKYCRCCMCCCKDDDADSDSRSVNSRGVPMKTVNRARLHTDASAHNPAYTTDDLQNSNGLVGHDATAIDDVEVITSQPARSFANSYGSEQHGDALGRKDSKSSTSSESSKKDDPQRELRPVEYEPVTRPKQSVRDRLEAMGAVPTIMAKPQDLEAKTFEDIREESVHDVREDQTHQIRPGHNLIGEINQVNNLVVTDSDSSSTSSIDGQNFVLPQEQIVTLHARDTTDSTRVFDTLHAQQKHSSRTSSTSSLPKSEGNAIETTLVKSPGPGPVVREESVLTHQTSLYSSPPPSQMDMLQQKKVTPLSAALVVETDSSSSSDSDVAGHRTHTYSPAAAPFAELPSAPAIPYETSVKAQITTEQPLESRYSQNIPEPVVYTNAVSTSSSSSSSQDNSYTRRIKAANQDIEPNPDYEEQIIVAQPVVQGKIFTDYSQPSAEFLEAAKRYDDEPTSEAHIPSVYSSDGKRSAQHEYIVPDAAHDESVYEGSGQFTSIGQANLGYQAPDDTARHYVMTESSSSSSSASLT